MTYRADPACPICKGAGVLYGQDPHECECVTSPELGAS